VDFVFLEITYRQQFAYGDIHHCSKGSTVGGVAVPSLPVVLMKTTINTYYEMSDYLQAAYSAGHIFGYRY
jgi:hypothetical protein